MSTHLRPNSRHDTNSKRKYITERVPSASNGKFVFSDYIYHNHNVPYIFGGVVSPNDVCICTCECERLEYLFILN